MKIKFILFFALAVLAISSCKDNEEETINPATEEILADGLNIGPDGVDTVVVFLKDSGLGVDINYSSGSGNGVLLRNVPTLLAELTVSAFNVLLPTLLFSPEKPW